MEQNKREDRELEHATNTQKEKPGNLVTCTTYTIYYTSNYIHSTKQNELPILRLSPFIFRLDMLPLWSELNYVTEQRSSLMSHD